MAGLGLPLPVFVAFWAQGEVTLPQEPDNGGPVAEFRADPEGAPLQTPTGRIVIFHREEGDDEEPRREVKKKRRKR